MGLQLEIFQTDEIDWSSKSNWENGLLEINRDDLLGDILKNPYLQGAELDWVSPGESARVVHVLDILRPAIKSDGTPCFPGLLSPANSGGEGGTRVLEGVLLAICGVVKGINPLFNPKEGLIDMSGSGADLSPFSDSHLIVLKLIPREGLRGEEIAECIRSVGLRTATSLARLTLGRPSGHQRIVDSTPQGKGLPSLGVLMQLGGEGLLHDTYVAGHSVTGTLPVFARYEQLVDGLVVGNNFTFGAQRNFTCTYQRNELLEDLCNLNGKKITLSGLVLTRGFSQESESKLRMASFAANLIQRLGAGGVIITTDGGGNAHIDTLLACQECEKRGLRTVILLNEMAEADGRDPGLVDFVAEANAIVSVGNREEIIELQAVERAVGGDTLLDEDIAAAGTIRVPLRSICGATNEMGAWRIGAEAF